MQVTLQTLKLNLSDNTKETTIDLLKKKISPLIKNKGSCDLTIYQDHSGYHIKANLNAPHETIHAEAKDQDFHHTLILLIEKLKKQIEKKKHTL